MSGGNINASKCVAYLRTVGAKIDDATSDAWVEQEWSHRDERRRHNRELKKSCGHFRTYITRIISDELGDEAVTTCHDCGKYLARKPWTDKKPPRPRKRKTA